MKRLILLLLPLLLVSDSPAQARGSYQTWLNVTGYSWGCGATQATASGEWPYVGGAAGSIYQFRFGTHIRVPGLWTVKINDRGGAITYGHLDVFFADCQQAINWGRRNVKVTVYT